jgi:hypothetical protein
MQLGQNLTINNIDFYKGGGFIILRNCQIRSQKDGALECTIDFIEMCSTNVLYFIFVMKIGQNMDSTNVFNYFHILSQCNFFFFKFPPNLRFRYFMT